MQNSSFEDECMVCRRKNIGIFCFKNKYQVLRCRSCGFLFAPVGALNLADFYTNPLYLHNKEGRGYVGYEIDKAPMKALYAKILGGISAHAPSRRLLDIGTAEGYLLDVATEEGYDAEGIDISPIAAEGAKRRGRRVRSGDVLSSGYPPVSFGVITAFDFFEHIPYDRARAYLATVHNLLMPQGMLAMITVDAGSVWARILGRHWHAFDPPEHTSFYNKRAIRTFLEHGGFEIIEAKTIHKYFSLQYIFNVIYHVYKFRLSRTMTGFLSRHPSLGKISLKLPIGDNMLVIARKV